MTEGPVATKIRDKLTADILPEVLEIIDEIRKHQGHVGAHPEGESHFRLRIKASSLDGLSRVERQRRVYALLAEEMAGRVHALSVEWLI